MKRVKKYITALLVIILLVTGTVAFRFFRSTMSLDELQLNFSQQSQKNAKHFFGVSDGQNVYKYFVASDGDKGKTEELFISRDKAFGRYVQAASSIGSETSDNPVGVYTFTPFDKTGKKESLQSLIIFSANKEHIYRYVYTLNTNGNSANFEHHVTSGQEFVSSIPNLGTMYNVKTQVTNIKFYNTDEKLICEYKAEYIP